MTYNGLPHTATVSITGVNGETGATVGIVNVSNTTHTNAGTYAADTGSSLARPITTTRNTTITDRIAKANATSRSRRTMLPSITIRIRRPLVRSPA